MRTDQRVMRESMNRLPVLAWSAAASVVLGAAIALTGCATSSTTDGRSAAADADGPRVVTEDIQAGIEQHIDEQTEQGGGYFSLTHEGRTLRLRLVRVHTEYLANLGPNRHFACVDLVTPSGDVYDVDFFMEGRPGDMRVTETTVHKLNARPFYVWKQNADGTWARESVDRADKPLLGVIEGEDRFRFSYEFTLPTIEREASMWLPLPQSDEYQTVEMVEAQTPVEWDVLDEQHHDNDVLYMTLGPEHSEAEIRFVYDVHRVEKSAYESDENDLERYLQPARLIPDDPIFHETVDEVTDDGDSDLVRARALYDHVIDHMKYAKYDNEYGRGDAIYACNAQTGNCTDYHSYFIALCRAADIPARFAIGAPIPSSRDDGGITGYHCWAEFHADGRWWPVDISESDKYSDLASYYFGHHPANRVEFSRGRDLVVEPGPDSGPINFLAYPVLEVDGRDHPIKPFLSFERLSDGHEHGRFAHDAAAHE